MKKSYRILSLILTVLLCTFLFVGCGDTPATSSGDTSSGGTSSGGDGKFVVYAPLSGELGDESFMDSANRGLEWARDRLGCEVRVIPASTDDPQAWDRNLREAAQNESVNLIVTGGTVVATTLEEIAPDFPNKPFIIFDAESNGDNVTGIVYKQNEGAFLAGALAALITKNADKFPNATGSNRVAIIGGEDIPVGRDFIAGFEAGAKYVDSKITVDSRFAGSFTDPQKGYDTAMAAINDGADVVYQCAGPAGLGVLKAAAEAKRYGLGSDSNQNHLHEGFIPASVIKAVDQTVFDAISQAKEGKLELGKTIVGDVSNKGMDLEMDEEMVPEDIRSQIEEIKAKIASGEIKPASYYDN